MQTGRLFIRNLPYVCKEEDIETMFAKFGKVLIHRLEIQNFFLSTCIMYYAIYIFKQQLLIFKCCQKHFNFFSNGLEIWFNYFMYIGCNHHCSSILLIFIILAVLPICKYSINFHCFLLFYVLVIYTIFIFQAHWQKHIYQLIHWQRN